MPVVHVPGPRRLIATAALVCVAMLSLTAAVATPAPAGLTVTAGSLPAANATTVTEIPAVGAIFVPSVLSLAVLLGLPHECSGSVVHSASRDLVLTAAHCVVGPGIGYGFAPEYHDGQAPEGVWSVIRVYVNPAWTRTQDPQHDYAFLQVAPQLWHGALRNLEDVAGAHTLATAPARASLVTVDGYVQGANDEPITCTATVYDTAEYPSFDCGGFGAGTSGGPWLQGSRVVGVIGGRQQGGCADATSYTSAFGPDIGVDLARAGSGAPGDFAPLGGSSGCPGG
ncbi:MAG: trypsin-like peptidase domain-containing protein [Actinomycetota bacterium]|nr:trypsin-like peptidase domain-containing protein [Actinomycetota bacterium]